MRKIDFSGVSRAECRRKSKVQTEPKKPSARAVKRKAEGRILEQAARTAVKGPNAAVKGKLRWQQAVV